MAGLNSLSPRMQANLSAVLAAWDDARKPIIDPEAFLLWAIHRHGLRACRGTDTKWSVAAAFKALHTAVLNYGTPETREAAKHAPRSLNSDWMRLIMAHGSDAFASKHVAQMQSNRKLYHGPRRRQNTRQTPGDSSEVTNGLDDDIWSPPPTPVSQSAGSDCDARPSVATPTSQEITTIVGARNDHVASTAAGAPLTRDALSITGASNKGTTTALEMDNDHEGTLAEVVDPDGHDHSAQDVAPDNVHAATKRIVINHNHAPNASWALYTLIIILTVIIGVLSIVVFVLAALHIHGVAAVLQLLQANALVKAVLLPVVAAIDPR